MSVETVEVKYHKECKKRKLYVVKKGEVALFGREWLHHITINWPEIKSVFACKSQNSLKLKTQNYSGQTRKCFSG